MPELRRDPIIGRWVIISTERAKRPNDFNINHAEEPEMECPFCEGREKNTPTEIFAIRKPGAKKDTPGWNVRVVPMPETENCSSAPPENKLKMSKTVPCEKILFKAST